MRGLDPRFHRSSRESFRRGWMGGQARPCGGEVRRPVTPPASANATDCLSHPFQSSCNCELVAIIVANGTPSAGFADKPAESVVSCDFEGLAASRRAGRAKG